MLAAEASLKNTKRNGKYVFVFWSAEWVLNDSYTLNEAIAVMAAIEKIKAK